MFIFGFGKGAFAGFDELGRCRELLVPVFCAAAGAAIASAAARRMSEVAMRMWGPTG
jgi:hypothetical protein